ncbi:hypothetical protein GLIP_3585 [Aliiglaciecola lipolytica E3]|uniref:Uncharacterized protein n=1 Tax=Aliiglaciecola lipolytica E3 TaxID=1127673 RepID=K6XX17_9ALTE|nr:hypothetical protein GLIP_3585 [Aliiglaciecola lipolytica E3]
MIDLPDRPNNQTLVTQTRRLLCSLSHAFAPHIKKLDLDSSM